METMDYRDTDKRMPPLVNLAGAAEILGRSAQYVHRIAEEEKLKGVKVGSTWIFRRTVVEKYNDDHPKKNGHGG